MLICNRCQYAVVPLQIEQHLRQHHRQLSLEQRRELADKADKILDIARIETDVIYPPTGQAPIDCLPLFFDGLKCLGKDAQGCDCTYVCRTKYSMQEHCKREHGWINPQKRGGDVRSKQATSAGKLWRCDCACQRFFKVGKWQRYFEVKLHSPSDGTTICTSQKHTFFRI